jgi:hypothetical protein
VLRAEGYNRPVRAQTGFNWTGRDDCFRLAPEQYGGIEFHDDAIIDCKWESTRRLVVPEIRSGAYAFRLRTGDGRGMREEYIVFFVRPERPTAPIVFLVPTGSYLAYANEHLSFDAEIMQPLAGQSPIVSEIDVELYQTAEFGLSLYDHHGDGAGVCYSSYRQPILNMRPKARMSSMGVTWQFPADLSIIAWLEHMGYAYDVVTDEDLHRDGVDLLKPYSVVLSGTHPEYVSEPILDAIEDYIADGGRFVYLGGNGFYWNVGYQKDEPWCMEVRKLNSGMRAWQARPGEYYLATARRAAYGRTSAGRRRRFSGSASFPRVLTRRGHSAACRIVGTVAWPGCSRASRAKSLAISGWRMAGLAASRSTAMTLPLARRRIHLSSLRRADTATIIRPWWRRCSIPIPVSPDRMITRYARISSTSPRQGTARYSRPGRSRSANRCRTTTSKIMFRGCLQMSSLPSASPESCQAGRGRPKRSSGDSRELR